MPADGCSCLTAGCGACGGCVLVKSENWVTKAMMVPVSRYIWSKIEKAEWIIQSLALLGLYDGFPARLPSFAMQEVENIPDFTKIEPCDRHLPKFEWQCSPKDLAITAHIQTRINEDFLGHEKEEFYDDLVSILASPMQRTTLGRTRLKRLQLPTDAKYMQWLYPVKETRGHGDGAMTFDAYNEDDDNQRAMMNFLQVGGFAYFRDTAGSWSTEQALDLGDVSCLGPLNFLKKAGVETLESPMGEWRSKKEAIHALNDSTAGTSVANRGVCILSENLQGRHWLVWRSDMDRDAQYLFQAATENRKEDFQQATALTDSATQSKDPNASTALTQAQQFGEGDSIEVFSNHAGAWVAAKVLKYYQIDENVTSPQGDHVYDVKAGTLWIEYENGGTKYVLPEDISATVRKAPCDVYIVIYDQLPVTASRDRSSEGVAVLSKGTRVEVLEIAAKPEEIDKSRVRARIASPSGWISIKMADDSAHYVQAQAPIVAPTNVPAPLCSVSGCGRPTWDAKHGSTCCRTCPRSDGERHGPECMKRNREQAPAKSRAHRIGDRVEALVTSTDINDKNNDVWRNSIIESWDSRSRTYSVRWRDGEVDVAEHKIRLVPRVYTLIPHRGDGQDLLQFKRAQKMPAGIREKLEEDGRFQDVTAQLLLDAGAKQFCWLMPNEKFPDDVGHLDIPHGGFAYIMNKEKFVRQLERYIDMCSSCFPFAKPVPQGACQDTSNSCAVYFAVTTVDTFQNVREKQSQEDKKKRNGRPS